MGALTSMTTKMHKGRIYYRKNPQDLTVQLTTHFKFHKANDRQKFGNQSLDGRPVCNGCGPSGWGWIFPQSILGACIVICAYIHNWDYQFGSTREHKEIADETFLDNMDRIFIAKLTEDLANASDARWGWWRRFKKYRARKKYERRLKIARKIFYKAVRVWGRSSFWDKRAIDFRLEDVGCDD